MIYMSDTEKKRVRRTTEERIAEVNAKIEELNGQIQSLEEKKQEAVTAYNDRIAKVMDRIKGLEKQKAAILAPKPPRKPRKTKKEKIQDLMKQAQRAGLKPEEIAERMCLTHGEQCPSTLPAIIDSNYSMGLPRHITVPLHEAGRYISLTYHLDTIAGS